MITFTRRVKGTHDPLTETWGPDTVTQITASGMQKRGDPQRYAQLGLVNTAAVTLLVIPTLYHLRAYTDEFVKPGDTVEWNGVMYTVRDVDPNPAPDGFVIGATVVIAR